MQHQRVSRLTDTFGGVIRYANDNFRKQLAQEDGYSIVRYHTVPYAQTSAYSLVPSGGFPMLDHMVALKREDIQHKFEDESLVYSRANHINTRLRHFVPYEQRAKVLDIQHKAFDNMAKLTNAMNYCLSHPDQSCVDRVVDLAQYDDRDLEVKITDEVDPHSNLGKLFKTVAEGDELGAYNCIRSGGNTLLTQCDPRGRSPFHRAVEKGHSRLVTLFLSEDPHRGTARSLVHDPCDDHRRYTPLCLCAEGGTYDHVRCINTLYDAGAGVDTKTALGLTPLQVACASGKLETARELIRRGANKNVRDSDNATLLHLAARAGNAELINYLVGEGLSVSARDHQNRIPLHHASGAGQLSAVNALLSDGAGHQVEDQNGKMAIHLAVGNEEVSSRLLDLYELPVTPKTRIEASTMEIAVRPDDAEFAVSSVYNINTQCDAGVEMIDMCVQIFRADDKEEICNNDADDDCENETDEIACACITTAIGATTFYASLAGSDANDCLSEASPCLTIQHAHDLAAAGDIIVLAGDTFIENTIDITKDISISGAGVNVTIIDGSSDGVFEVADGISLTLCGVTVQNAANGLLNFGTANVFNSSFINNVASNGAAIFNIGTLNVVSTTFSDNDASSDGGSILNLGTASLTNATIQNGTANIGGGISNSGTLTVLTSTVTGNSAADFLGGGGIENSASGTLTLTESTVQNNSAPNGAGIINRGSATIIDSTFTQNIASADGGGFTNFGTAAITGSTFNTNSAVNGAGIITNAASFTIVNSTISGNVATSSGGGIANNANGKTIANSTITDNSAAQGAGIFSPISTSAFHTIVANSLGGADCFGVVSEAGFSLSEDGSCGFLLTGDPNLDSLQDNGGPTFTHELLPTSIAIDSGAVNCGVTTDQRGEPRPANINCDIGAFEVQP